MTAFASTTAFGLVRRLAAIGTGSPSLYLLISDADAIHTIETDIEAEVQVQLGIELRSLVPDRFEEAYTSDLERPVTLITIDPWLPKLAVVLDRNVVLLSRGGATLLLAGKDTAERILAAAPNLRNRLTDVLAIQPDEAFRRPTA